MPLIGLAVEASRLSGSDRHATLVGAALFSSPWARTEWGYVRWTGVLA